MNIAIAEIDIEIVGTNLAVGRRRPNRLSAIVKAIESKGAGCTVSIKLPAAAG